MWYSTPFYALARGINRVLSWLEPSKPQMPRLEDTEVELAQGEMILSCDVAFLPPGRGAALYGLLYLTSKRLRFYETGGRNRFGEHGLGAFRHDKVIDVPLTEIVKADKGFWWFRETDLFQPKGWTLRLRLRRQTLGFSPMFHFWREDAAAVSPVDDYIREIRARIAKTPGGG